MKLIRGEFKSPDLAILDEGKSSEVDGKHILGKIAGTFFVPNGTSRNNRFYSEQLWNKQLSKPEIQERVQEKRMFGTISHEAPINDMSLLEGKISHITTKLEIRGTQGYGEALILNTPAGQILNNVLRAGAKLFVSSRAEGRFNGETAEGVPKVDENEYFLQGFDVVLDPGFLQAEPDLIEKLEKLHKEEDNTVNDNKNDISEGDNKMSNEIITTLTREKIQLENEVVSLSKDLEAVKNESIIIQNENKTLQDENSRIANELDSVKEKASKTDSYEEIGSVEEIKAKLEAYTKLGSPEEIKEKLDTNEAILAEYAEKDLGSAEEIEKAFKVSSEVIEKYREFGSIEDIAKVFEAADIVADNHAAKQKEADIKTIAEDLGISEDKVAKLYGKMSVEEIREYLKDLAESNENFNKWRKDDKKENKVDTSSKEERSNPLLPKINQASAIIERYSK